MSKLADLKKRALTIGGECLDELVHELKSSEASSINNGGASEQIDYIVEAMGQEAAITKLEELLK